MAVTNIFKSGNLCAVRLPKEFALHAGDKVEIFKRKNDIIIRTVPTNLVKAFELLSSLPDDFFDSDRKNLPPSRLRSSRR